MQLELAFVPFSTIPPTKTITTTVQAFRILTQVCSPSPHWTHAHFSVRRGMKLSYALRRTIQCQKTLTRNNFPVVVLEGSKFCGFRNFYRVPCPTKLTCLFPSVNENMMHRRDFFISVSQFAALSHSYAKKSSSVGYCFLFPRQIIDRRVKHFKIYTRHGKYVDESN